MLGNSSSTFVNVYCIAIYIRVSLHLKQSVLYTQRLGLMAIKKCLSDLRNNISKEVNVAITSAFWTLFFLIPVSQKPFLSLFHSYKIKCITVLTGKSLR